MNRYYLLGLLCFCFVSVLGQVPNDMVHKAPFYTVYNHLYYLQEDSYDPQKAARSFTVDQDPSKWITQAIQLKEILDGKGVVIDLQHLSKDSMWFDSLKRAHVYQLSKKESRIYLERRGHHWVYSKATLEQIPTMYEEVFPLGGTLRKKFHAPIWKKSFLGVAWWQYFSLLTLLGLGLLLYSVLHFFLQRGIRPFIPKEKYDLWLDSGEIRKSSRLLSLWAGVFFVKTFLAAIHLPVRLHATLIFVFELLQIFFVLFFVLEVSRMLFLLLDKWADTTESYMDDQLMPLLSRLTEIVIWVLGLFYILDFLNVNVTALLAGISIGGLAIALAAQDTVKNVFGSVMIFLDKPFKIGDSIRFNNVDGVVERVGVRSTRIRTVEDSLTYVPNAKFAESIVDNLGMRVYRRFKTHLGVTYDTSPELIDVFIEGVKAILRLHPRVRQDNFEVSLNEFGASSLDILLFVFFEVDNWRDELKVRHEVMQSILHLAHVLGVRFAFPSQTVFIEEMPGQSSLTPEKMKGEEARMKMEAFVTRMTRDSTEDQIDEIK